MSAYLKYKEERSGGSIIGTLDDIWNCYRLFLGRVPDEGGFNAYSALVSRGITTTELASMFVGSPEFGVKVQAPIDHSINKAKVGDYELYVPSSDAVVGEEILASGVYEPHVTNAIKSSLRPGQTIIDIGANIGYFSILACKAVGEHGHVYAVEPLARNVKTLLTNKMVNKADNMTVLPFAVSDKEGFVALMPMGSIASSREIVVDDLLTANALEFSYTQTIDELVPSDKKVDIIKIDIDGFDHKALRGARRVINQSRPEIFAEFAPDLLRQFSEIEPVDYLKMLVEHGYTSFDALLRDGKVERFGMDVDALAALPKQLGATHVDIHVYTAS